MSKRIWNKEALDRYELDSLNPGTVDEAEKILKVKLPTSYINLLQEQNGGSLYLNKFPLKNLEESYIEVNYLWGIGNDAKQGIFNSTYLIEEWNLPKKLILLNGDGHTWIALDYRNNFENPSVVFLDIERNIELNLANNFEEFITKLYRDENLNDVEELLFEINKTEFTQEEGETVFSGNSLGPISFALLHFLKVDTDLNWLLSKIEILSKNEDPFIVIEAEEALMELILKNPKEISKFLIKIEGIINLLKVHKDLDVKNYAKKIETQLKCKLN